MIRATGCSNSRSGVAVSRGILISDSRVCANFYDQVGYVDVLLVVCPSICGPKCLLQQALSCSAGIVETCARSFVANPNADERTISNLICVESKTYNQVRVGYPKSRASVPSTKHAIRSDGICSVFLSRSAHEPISEITYNFDLGYPNRPRKSV